MLYATHCARHQRHRSSCPQELPFSVADAQRLVETHESRAMKEIESVEDFLEEVMPQLSLEEYVEISLAKSSEE